MQRVLHNPSASSVLYNIDFNRSLSAFFYLILILVNGLAVALSLDIAWFVFLAPWQRVGVQWGVCAGQTFEAPMPVQ